MNARVFNAIADPKRRGLLLSLADSSPRTATQLAAVYPITRQGVLKHLKVLEAAGLVSAARKGREQRFYLTPEPLAELDQWIKQIETKWDERLLRLKQLLENR